jgi:hypothetical protein
MVPSKPAKKNAKDLSVLLSNVKIEPVARSEEPFDVLEFKRTVVYKSIEQASIIGEGLEFKTESKKLDLDSHSCTQVCSSYLACVERLATHAFEIDLDPKRYRTGFSTSYKLLLQRNGDCSYVTEVLDSAQEGYPHMWVNSEKYIFSDHVIENGLQLYSQFSRVFS